MKIFDTQEIDLILDKSNSLQDLAKVLNCKENEVWAVRSRYTMDSSQKRNRIWSDQEIKLMRDKTIKGKIVAMNLNCDGATVSKYRNGEPDKAQKVNEIKDSKSTLTTQTFVVKNESQVEKLHMIVVNGKKIKLSESALKIYFQVLNEQN